MEKLEDTTMKECDQLNKEAEAIELLVANLPSETIINFEDLKKCVENWEYTYKMSTEEFRKYFEENGKEGNVDMQLWYMVTSN